MKNKSIYFLLLSILFCFQMSAQRCVTIGGCQGIHSHLHIIDETVNEIDEKVDVIDETVNNIDEKVDEINKKIDQLPKGDFIQDGANIIVQDGLYTLTKNIEACIEIDADKVIIDLFNKYRMVRSDKQFWCDNIMVLLEESGGL